MKREKPPPPERSAPAAIPVAVRQAAGGDLEAIVELGRSLDPADWGIANWPRWLARDECLNLVAVAGERVVGCFHGREVRPAQGFVQVLRVDRAFRRRGVGARLTAAMELALSRRGLVVARCTTGDANRPARRLFAAAGYRQAAELRRLRRSRWSPRRRIDLLPPEAAAELALALGLAASRPAPAHFLRVYHRPAPAEVERAARRGRILAAGEAAAWLDPPGPEGVWVSALGGPPEAVRRLVEALPRAATLTVDAPASRAAALDGLGFDSPRADDRYVLLEKRLDRSAGPESRRPAGAE